MSRKLLERLVASTYYRLDYSVRHAVSQSEETITEINLLDIARRSQTNLLVEKTSKHQEAWSGVDWEWWVRQSGGGFRRYAVQAKKLSARGVYTRLDHTNAHGKQIDSLMNYARANRCSPIYAFYNYPVQAPSTKHWHCCEDFDEPQLGCTVTHARVVANVWPHGVRFDSLHSRPTVLPWRCVLCPSGERAVRTGQEGQRSPNSLSLRSARTVSDDESESDDQNSFYERLPSFLEELASRRQSTKFSIESLPRDLYRRQVGAPKRIAVLGSSPDEG
jgi:hypothetical protein